MKSGAGGKIAFGYKKLWNQSTNVQLVKRKYVYNRAKE